MCASSTTQHIASLAYSDADGDHPLVLDRDATSIGRASDQDLVLQDGFASRRHALIVRVDGGFELVDQNSSHGTFVNGVRVEKSLLKSGDVVQFGSIHARQFRFQEEAEAQSHPSFGEDLFTALQASQSGQDGRQGAHEMEQLSFLISAARELNAGNAITDVLHVLLRSSLKLTGVERGFVFLRENGDMRLALGLRSDGAVVDEDSTLSRRAMQKAIESESTFYLGDTLSDLSAANWASVVANSIRSIYCIPLRKQISPAEPNRLLGLLYLDSQINAGKLSEIDHQVLDLVATEAATLLHNALLAESDLKARRAAEQLALAAQIHASLMSITLPELSYAALRARSVPCLEIGGDFYDAVALPDCVGAVVADVSGKGIPAAIVAATLQGIVHAQLLSGHSLSEIASLVNQFLCTRETGRYATMVLIKLWPNGDLEYINCGHIAPVLVNQSGAGGLQRRNLIVGLIPEAKYTSAHTTLSGGDRILLVSDGITETENEEGEQFGQARLEAVAASASPEEVLRHLAAFRQSRETQDDCTLLEVSYQQVADLEESRQPAGEAV